MATTAADVLVDTLINWGVDTVNLLRESCGVGKFKVEDRGNQVEAQTKASAAVAIAFSQDAKNLQATVDMFSDNPQVR